MHLPINIPEEKRALLDTLVARLSALPGVKAIVLGGSYARGAQRPTSDLDIGIYYTENDPFEIADIRSVAESISSPETLTVTGFYGWGPWVNGGAWIHTPAGKVDFIYRNLDQVSRTIDESVQGITHFDYMQQPPYGFHSVIYLAETSICIPLYDPEGWVDRIKQRVCEYPPRLKEKIVSESLWLSEFTLFQARSFASSGDVYTTAGCQTRIAMYLTQALFALNEEYFVTDKTAQAEIASFPIRPPDYPQRLSKILSSPGSTPQELIASVHDLETLFREIVPLGNEMYQPKFVL